VSSDPAKIGLKGEPSPKKDIVMEKLQRLEEVEGEEELKDSLLLLIRKKKRKCSPRVFSRHVGKEQCQSEK